MIMKKTLLFLFVLMMSLYTIGQKTMVAPTGINDEGTRVLTDAQSVPGPAIINTQTDAINVWALPSTNSTSPNSRIPRNTTVRYQREEYLILPSEMAACGFPNGADITSIGFLIQAAGVGTQTGTLTIYLKNTNDVSYTLGSNWTTTGFTTVCNNGAFTVPIALGAYDIPFVGGSSFTYTGGGLYVAWEFSNPAGTLGTTSLVAYCNTSQTTLCYGYQSATAQGTALAVTAYRPATALGNSTLIDVLSVTNIYTTEKDPIPYGVPNKVGVRVSNVSAASATFDLTFSTNSTPPYTITQTGITLAANSSATYNFTGWSPTTQENVNVTGSVTIAAGENFTTNNTRTIPIVVNNNLYSYCNNFALQAAYGFTYPATGIWANKYHMTGAGTITGANIYIYSSATPANSGIGNAVYAVVLNSLGAIVAQSADMVLATGNVNMIDNFTFPTPPPFLDEDFYVGLATTAGTAQWYPMGCMTEAPVRSGAFYEFDLAGGTPAASTLDVKFMIEAQVTGATLAAHDVGTLSIDIPNVVSLGVYSPKATIKNFGANPESFNVTMTIGAGYTSTQSVVSLASGASQQVTFAPWTNSLGDYSVNVCTALAGDLDATNDCKTQSVKVLDLNKQVYGYLAFKGTGTDPVGPTTFNLSTPGTLNSLADQSLLQFVNGGTWAMNTWYGTVYNTVAPFDFVTINPLTGSRTVIGDMGLAMSGLSYNTASGIMYAVAYNSTTTSTDLYTLNLATGVPILVGSAAGVQLINLAINSSGNCYAVDITADNLGMVNLATGAFTVVGPIGFNANYAQDMEFDRQTGELYMAAQSLTSGWLAWVNQATGATVKIGDFEGGGEITGFAIPYPYIQPEITVTGTVTGEESNCYNASNTITVAGASPFTLESGGSAIFIAGQKISYMPGTTIQNGAYMHGYISTTYCDGIAPAMPVAVAGQSETPISFDQAFFTLYPNPTNGNFTIVQKGDMQYGNVKVEVYGMHGDQVLSAQMIGEKTHEFITADLPAGLYFVKVVADDYVETIKLVKTR
jgi:hypothetical protein